jgi:hypothetical protein
MAIVVICFDGYCDLWDDFAHLANKHWADRPYRLYMVNNIREVSYSNIVMINAGSDAEWSRKVLVALDNISEKNICLLLEDFFFSEAVDNGEIHRILELMEQEAIVYYKLSSMTPYSKSNTPLYKGIPELHVLQRDDEYAISLQAAIWNRNYLALLVGSGNYNAWAFEFDRTQESRASLHLGPIYGCVFDSRDVLHLKHGVVQGRFVPDTVKFLQRAGHQFSSKRPIMLRHQVLMYKIKCFGRQIVPVGIRSTIKAVLELCGMRFVFSSRSKCRRS